jgi:thioredoxin 2
MSETRTQALLIVCPHCDTLNRAPAHKLAAGGKCGECHQALFDGHPLALDTARFRRQLDKSDIPLLVDFWAAWCGPCRAMAPEFERAAVRLEPQFRLVKVNVDEEPEIAAQYRVQSIPTVALLLHGRELARRAGAMPASALVEWAMAHRPG